MSIAGFDFSVRTDAKPKYVRELASYVEQKIEEAESSGKSVSTQNLVMLAAMSITDELRQLEADQRDLRKDVRERSKRILDTLDREAKA